VSEGTYILPSKTKPTPSCLGFEFLSKEKRQNNFLFEGTLPWIRG
jgi:hypothetical protein